MLGQYANISASDLELFKLTDDPAEAVQIVEDYSRTQEQALASDAAAATAVPYAEQLTAEGTRQGMPVSVPPLGKHPK